jgi:hypothetical protein
MPGSPLSADLFESASNRSPKPTVLFYFYATDDDRWDSDVVSMVIQGDIVANRRPARQIPRRTLAAGVEPNAPHARSTLQTAVSLAA